MSSIAAPSPLRVVTLRAVIRPSGAGRTVAGAAAPSVSNSCFSDFSASFALCRFDQPPISSSTGCNARLSSTDAAMIDPTEICRSTARTAASPSASDWRNSRMNLAIAA
ncbi:hypothetical protein QP175_15440 [Sphingomonas aerolata]